MSFNMTKAEANQRAAVYNATIRWDRDYRQYRVALDEWYLLPRYLFEAQAYYTDDLEDAVLTAGAMRKEADAKAS